MNGQTDVNSFEYEIDALAAIQLGWLVVETFGRLRRYQRAIRKPESRRGDQTRPFAFSINESLSLDALVWRVNQLHYRVEKAGLPPPPCPKGDELEKQLNEGFDLDALHEDLDNWSRQVWSLLNVEMGVLGQAFFYGGSLANTYWYTAMDWSDDKTVRGFLNRYRLTYIGTQFELIAEALPPYVAASLKYSLHKWSEVDLEQVDKEKLRSRLEAQQKAWHDLLFGRRSPASYLRARHYRLINLCANGARIGVALALIAFVAVAGYGIGGLLGEETTDWASFLAALSSFVVVISGLVTRFFSWINLSGDFVEERLKHQLILMKTYRSWKSSRNLANDDAALAPGEAPGEGQ